MVKTTKGNKTKKGKILVLLGLSASGKDTQCELIKDRLNYNFVISHTTRPMRPSESQMNPYYFVSDSEFGQTDMIEKREYPTTVGGIDAIWKYGVAKNSIDLNSGEDYIVVLDYAGYQEFIEYFGDDSIIGIYLDVDEPIRRQRCINRKDFDYCEWTRREIADNISFEGVRYSVDAIIKSDNIETTYQEIMEVLNI